MRECSSCGHPNAEDAEFCANRDCRAYLGWSTNVVEVPTQPDAAAPLPRETRSVGPSRPAPAVREQRAGVRVSLSPASLEVDPGGAITTQLTVHNTGTQVEQFRVIVSGPAAPCALVEPPAIRVFPDAEQPVTIRFAPGRSSRTPAGRLPFVASAHSMLHTDLHDDASGTLTIGAFTDLQAGCGPRPAVVGARPDITYSRRTTATSHSGCGSRGATARGRVDLRSAPYRPSTLPPGGHVESPATIGGARKWFGRTQTHNFTATVAPFGRGTPGGAQRRTASGPDLPVVDPHGGGGAARVGDGDRGAVAQGQGASDARPHRGRGDHGRSRTRAIEQSPFPGGTRRPRGVRSSILLPVRGPN